MENWQQVKEIFADALRQSPEDRGKFLDRVCGDDKRLRGEVESLLTSFDSAASFMESPAIGEVAESIVDNENQLIRGQKISHYEIIKQIGAGGMGEVYLAKDGELERLVALKVLSAGFLNDADYLRRFVQEAKSVSALNHPNILTIYEIGTAGKTRYIASELVKGETLRDRLRREPLALTNALDIAVQIALALQAAHEAHIIHRDIKPENVMIRDDGLIKVLDFGLAKLIKPPAFNKEFTPRPLMKTEKGLILGTAAYMSPEQARGKTIDTRSDIWSLGVVLYEMFAGFQPFAGETTSDVIAAILKTEPAPLVGNLPAELLRIVAQSLRKNVDDRYKSAKDLLTDLRQLKRQFEINEEIKQHNPPNLPVETELEKSAQIFARQTSIAVLPFANLSSRPENDYFCDGLTDELSNALAKIAELKVSARASAFFFKGKETDVDEIGRVLNIENVLKGSVRKSGNRLRIMVQLVNTADGYHLWSEQYDREMKDVFDVQDEITLTVVNALKLKLLGRQKAAVLKRYTDNTEAYELYLKGRFYYNKHLVGCWQEAINYFEQAIEKEPEYALAYVWIGFCQAALWYYGFLSSSETIPSWKASASRALKIDDDLAEAHLSQGSIRFYYQWNWAEAEREYRRAIELKPNYADAGWRYGLFLASRKRFDQAIGEGRRSVALDPLSPVVYLYLGLIYLLADRTDDALEQVGKMLEIEPNYNAAYRLLGMVCAAREMYEEAVEAFQKSLDLGGGQIILSHLGATYGILGKRTEALSIISRLLEKKETQNVVAFNIARVYIGLGESDLAVEWLEKAVEERNGELVFLRQETIIERFASLGQNIGKDSRFQNLMRRIGLIENENAEITTRQIRTTTPSQVFLNTGQITNQFKQNKTFALIALIGIIFTGAALFIFFYRQSSDLSNSKNNASRFFEQMQVTRLKSDKKIYSPIIAPDGKSFIYIALDNGQQAVVLQNIATGKTADIIPSRPNTHYWSIRLTPDGKQLYYVVTDDAGERGQLRRITVGGGESQFLADNVASVSIALDGRHIAFKRSDGGSFVLVIADADGGNAQTLMRVDASSQFMSFEWSPDSASLVYTFYRHQSEKDIWYVAELPCCETGKAEEKIIVQPRSTKIVNAVWLADKSGLIINAVDGTSEVPQLWRVDYPSGKVERITNDSSVYKVISLSADGKKLLVEQVNVSAHLFFAPAADISRAQPLFTGTGRDFRGLSWTPDGHIICGVYDGKNWDLWKFSPDGNLSQQLTADAGRNYAPTISPDGNSVVFVSTRTGSPQLWRTKPDGTSPEQLTTMPAQVDEPQFSADGQNIFFTHNLLGKPRLWKIPAEGGVARQLVETPVRGWAISPDGEKIAYIYIDEKSGKSFIALRKTDQPEILQSYEFAPSNFLRWAKDGNGLEYISKENGSSNIWRYPFDNQRANRLTDLQSDFIVTFGWSPDGETLAYASGNAIFEAVLFTLK